MIAEASASTLADVLEAWAVVTGHRAVDLFAGPGGWDLAAVTIGLEVLGVEWDDSACATRAAAGLRTLQADVGGLDPAAFGPVEGLIGSPPCPTFSRAGRGGGLHLTEIIVACLRALTEGRDTRAKAREEAYETLAPLYWDAERATALKRKREPDREKSDALARRDAAMSVLVCEPLRWILALGPQWVALEQVPDVLPLWRVVGGLLESLGYSVWCGVLEAERYGVPQTRDRAVLMARRTGVAEPPRPTHQRYVPNEPRWTEPEITLEGEILPWVSMADALGWGAVARPVVTVTAGGSRQGGHGPLDGGSGARQTMQREREREKDSGFRAYRRTRGAGLIERDGTRPDTPISEPAPTLTGKARSDQWVYVAGAQTNQSVRGGAFACSNRGCVRP